MVIGTITDFKMHSAVLVFFLAASALGSAFSQSDAEYHHALLRRALDIPPSINGYNYIGCYTYVLIFQGLLIHVCVPWNGY